MKPLQTNRLVLTWIYLYPVQDVWWKQLLRIMLGLSAFLVMVANLTMGAVYFYLFVSTDLESAVFALFHIVACSSISYEMICAFYLRHKMPALFDELSFIYDSRKLCTLLSFDAVEYLIEIIANTWFYSISTENLVEKTDMFTFLVQINEKSEWIWSFYFKYVMAGTLASTSMMSAISMYFCWMQNGRIDTEYLFHPQRIVYVIQR